uniref:Integrin_alpha2 domain-containing protein n=1 Tax=Rhabditophanes sp. KR3021 TaxID=114890 RepID=A0AC35TM88_9BILA
MVSQLRFLLLLAFLIPNYEAFNIDTKKAIIHRVQADSLFGWSLDFMNNKKDFFLIVGAPKAQSAGNRLIKQGGAVYSCQTTSNKCQELLFDRQGNENRLNGSRSLPIEDKSYQLFGSTVVASGNNILACAPHYKYFFSKFEVIEPVGTCYYAQNNFDKITEFAPCRQEPAKHGHHRFGYGMCGFSASIADQGNDRLFINGPGMWYWQGGVFSQNVNNVTDRPNTADGPASHDHFTRGYSSAVGDFDGDNLDDVVTGVPRGNDLLGFVSIYSRSLRSIANLTEVNAQRGQYFGAAVAATDLNNDGLDDIIVGSPFFTDYKTVKDIKTQESKPQYDVGKISIFLQTAVGVFSEPIQIVGHTQWSRFGYSVAGGGDINGDGYNDIVVGAPYDGDDGKGAVYIYHGSKDGINQKFTQKIEAKQIHSDLKTFGFALASGKDIDGNEYNDIAVGAMQSSRAVILRAKPVIKVEGEVKTTKKNINLDDKHCMSEFGRIACEKVKYCIKYDGKLTADYKNVDIKVRVQLDSKKPLSPRPFFSKKDLDRKKNVVFPKDVKNKLQPDIIEQTLPLIKGRELCDTFEIYIPDTIRDKVTPISITVNYTYIERIRPGSQLDAALDTTTGASFESELMIDKNCGDDNTCTPDLQLHATTNKDKFILGAADQNLIVNVSVRNRGEDSYLSQFFIDIPKGFEYGGIESQANSAPVSCSPFVEEESEEEIKSKKNKYANKSSKKTAEQKKDSYKFVCDIGNPLPANKEAVFGFILAGTKVEADTSEVVIKMLANSTFGQEQDGNEKDNELIIKVPVEIKAMLDIVGRSHPEQVDFSIRNKTLGVDATFDHEVGPLVSHLFQVINRGPSIIDKSSLDIFWPSYSESGNHLLYLIDTPMVSDSRKVKCKVRQSINLNPESLTIGKEHIEKSVIESGKSDKKKDTSDSMDYRGVKNKRSFDDLSHDERVRAQKKELKNAVLSAKGKSGAVEYKGTLHKGNVDCGSLNCTQITCEIGQLKPDEFVLVEVFSRLWVNSLIEDTVYEADISSLALAKIISLPIAPKYSPPPQSIAVSTNINPTDPEAIAQNVPWWLWLLAILIAIIILACCILCLWRCGFFKRNRPQAEHARLAPGIDGQTYYADSSSKYGPPGPY